MKIIPAVKEKVIIDRDEYERLYDLVYRVASMKPMAPCGNLVEAAKDCNRALMKQRLDLPYA